MWCPSTSLSVWANAWLAGRAAPDDVLDALSAWAPVQSVAVYDAISIGESGLAWAGGTDGGAAALLQLVRGAGPSAAGDGIRPVFPVPGDVRGLPAGTIFAQEAGLSFISGRWLANSLPLPTSTTDTEVLFGSKPGCEISRKSSPAKAPGEMTTIAAAAAAVSVLYVFDMARYCS